MRDNGSDGNPTAPDSLRGFPPAPEHDEDTGLTPTFNSSRKPAGRRFFDEMDRDHDGKLKLDDLKVAMRRKHARRNIRSMNAPQALVARVYMALFFHNVRRWRDRVGGI